jgi:adenosylhomocysteine nucleosidase
MQLECRDVRTLQIDDPCVLFALRRERGPFCREFPSNQPFPGSPCWASFGGPAWLSVLTMETGVGRASVSRALDWLFAKPKLDDVAYEPTLLIYAGFAGAATPDLHVGDIVLADEVVDEHGRAWRTTWPEMLPEERWTPPLHRGRLVSTEQLSHDPRHKRALFDKHHAIAIDMESAGFAERCSREGVLFACVRAISDEVDTPLSPNLVSLLSGGAASPFRVLRTLLRHPSMLPELLRLARDTKRASEQLGLALGELLTLTLPWEL